MSIEVSIDFNEPRIAAFLAEASGSGHFEEHPQAPEGFVEVGKRENTRDAELVDAVFGLRELYRLEMNGSSAGVVSADVIKGQSLEVWVEYVVYGQSDLSAEQSLRLAALLDDHDVQQPLDLEGWLVEQIRDGWISREQIVVAGLLHLKKIGDPIDINASQRDALLSLYGLGPFEVQSRIELLTEDTFTRWSRVRNSELFLVGAEPITQVATSDTLASAEIPESGRPGAAADAAIDGLLDQVARVLVPVRCVEGFRRHNQRMVSVAGWPEFKIEWQFRTVRVGCARIQIPVPLIRTRISNLVCFLYYYLPTYFDQALFEILKACAIRSALTGTVVGIVLGNPAAAIVAFKANFTSCLKEESFACLNPGLYLVKESSGWT